MTASAAEPAIFNGLIGIELFTYLAGDDLAFMETCVSLSRACLKPVAAESGPYRYTISDLEDIVSIADLPIEFNPIFLQRSQLEWLFLFARHFCDELAPGDLASLAPQK